ncbi:MAG: glycosyltransferase family 1 protein [Candidatus Bathyarchaeia archaeon]
MERTLRVAIDAQIFPGGGEGGIEQFLIGLVHGLGQLTDGPEEYIIVGHWQGADWLAPYLGPNQRLLSGPQPQQDHFEKAKRLLGPFRKPAGVLWREVQRVVKGPPPPYVPTIPVSDGFYEGLGADVLHITYPLHFVQAAVPTVFTIHDLQHRHYPEFFNRRHLMWRETVYPAAFRHARAIAAVSRYVRKDVIEQYGVDLYKVYAIPSASPTACYQPVSNHTLTNVQRKFRLPSAFMLYPALTYQHKNHVRLLEAIALLRNRDGFAVNLVCTGQLKHFWPSIKKQVRELKLQNQVRFLGFVSATELRALYRLAQFVIFPSLFEGAGLPLLEAFREGTPVACSDIPAFREYGGDAVYFLDPTSVESIAKAIRCMASDTQLRTCLREKGASRIRLFSWERTAKMYRALYRKVAGRPLSDEDQCLLAAAVS